MEALIPTAAVDAAAAPATPVARTSSRARFEAQYAAHAPAVLAYARRRTDDPQSAQDVLADTFLVAWRRRDEVPDDALPWLYAVARNVLGNQRRAARRQIAVADRMLRERRWDQVDEHDAGGDHEVLRALAELRPIDREALLLTAWEDLDAGRAAVAAGCSRAAFHVRLHRARKRLAALLEDRHAPVAPPAATSEPPAAGRGAAPGHGQDPPPDSDFRSDREARS